MRTFAELFRLFPKELMELCLKECFADRRPVFYIDEMDELNDPCWFCPKQRIFIRMEYNERWGIPNNYRESHCGNEPCKMLCDWYWNDAKQYQRRKAFRNFHGGKDLDDFDLENRAAAALAYILKYEAFMKEKNGRDTAHISRAA